MLFKKIVCLSIFISLIFADEEILHVYYTFKKDPAHSFVINIQSTAHEDFSIQLKQNHSVLDKKFSKGSYFELPAQSRYIHLVEFDGLQPNMLYEIEISHQGKLVKESKVQTLSDNISDIKVVIGGDLEMIHASIPILEQIKQSEPSVIFFGGDYPKDVYSLHDYKKWDEWLKTTSEILIKKNGACIPWILAIGNNEVFGSFNQPIEKAPFFHAFFNQSPHGNHYFHLNIHEDLLLIILDSGLTAQHDGDQKVWLESVLSSNKNIPIKMALYHVPIYPSVRFREKNWYYRLAQSISKLKDKKNIASRLFSPQSMEGFKHWAPLFDEYKVTCAFEHHDHAFKRTGPIRNGETQKEKGTYYLGDGALAPYPQFTPIQKFCDFRLKKSIGHVQFFWLMTFQSDTIDFQAISSYGKSIDHFSIKGPYE